jgi:hypothetical protein
MWSKLRRRWARRILVADIASCREDYSWKKKRQRDGVEHVEQFRQLQILVTVFLVVVGLIVMLADTNKKSELRRFMHDFFDGPDLLEEDGRLKPYAKAVTLIAFAIFLAIIWLA